MSTEANHPRHSQPRNRPRVFISYSHDSPDHENQVLSFSEHLRQDGIDTSLDQYLNGTPEQGWPRWMMDQLDQADYVLVVCTKTYYRRFRGHEEPGKGKGADWEGSLITQQLYDARSNTAKFVPILFSPDQQNSIPEPLRPLTFYTLTDEIQYSRLYEFLLGQSGYKPGSVGQLKLKNRSSGNPLTFKEPGNWLAEPLTHLIGRFTSRSKPDPVSLVAHRFIQLFSEHGVPTAQIPRLVPNLTLDKLISPEALLPHLTGELLEQVAHLFAVRRTWIEGVEDVIYDCSSCYKDPTQFFEDLARINTDGVVYPIRALFCTSTLSMQDNRTQSLALVLLDKIAGIGEETICRYHVCFDQWDWGYWKCRIQLKAMAPLVDKLFHKRIPPYQATPQVVETICSGACIPHIHPSRRMSEEISLEDFALGPDESARSKEPEELPTVLEYIENNDLENIARKLQACVPIRALWRSPKSHPSPE
jgi:hypothetical protein